MGGAFSGASIGRFVGGVEIIVSGVIVGFGGQTLHLFYNMDTEFRKEYVRIQYSAITSICEGVLAILAALLLILGTRRSSSTHSLYSPDDRGDNSTAHAEFMTALRRRRKLAIVYKLWMALAVVSVGLLLLVFLSSMTYCIQNEHDRKLYKEITRNGEMTTRDGKSVSPCYSESPDILNIREALIDLYSYCLVNIFTLCVFFLVIYYRLKSVMKARNSMRKTEDMQKCIVKDEKPDLEN